MALFALSSVGVSVPHDNLPPQFQLLPPARVAAKSVETDNFNVYNVEFWRRSIWDLFRPVYRA